MIGQTLGHYIVREKIGAGGMGEVYRARDQHLERDVALKILPTGFLANDAARKRLRREALALSKLNHPNIATVFDFDTQGNVDFLAMELIQGTPLSDRVKAGPMAEKEILRLGIQLAEGLAAAHAQGVIHRDLKPGNLMVTREGRLKILDFGLAVLAHPEGDPDLTRNSAETAPVEGTLPYMPPEQLRGQPTDTRSDIYAAGAVLYEMATGQRPFPHSQNAELIGAILHESPLLPSRRNPEVTSGFESIVMKSLDKEPAQRYQSARELLLALEGACGGVARRLHSRSVVIAVGIGTLAAVLVAVAVGVNAGGLRKHLFHRGTAVIAPFSVNLPKGESIPPTYSSQLVFSQDGKVIAYASLKSIDEAPAMPAMSMGSGAGASIRNAAGMAPMPMVTEQIYVRPLDQQDARPIEGALGDEPFFSPDGKWLGFWHAPTRTLRKVALSGGAPVKIADAESGISGAAWGAEDTIVYAWFDLFRVSATGGSTKLLLKVDEQNGERFYRHPSFLPGGKAVLFTIGMADTDSYDNARIGVVSLDSGEKKILIEGGTGARYSPSGHLVYARGGKLLAVPFDPKKLQVTGQPVPVVDGVFMSSNTGMAAFSISADGSLVYAVGAVEGGARVPVWVDRKGTATPLPLPPRSYLHPRLSPDGRQLAIEVEGASHDFYAYDLSRGVLTKMSFDGASHWPIWTPKGDRLTFRSWKTGTMTMWWMPTDRSGPPELLTNVGSMQSPESWSPDGKTLALTQMDDPQSGSDIYVLALDGDRRPHPLIRSRFSEGSPKFSPDGKWLAYSSNESGRPEIYAMAYPGPGPKIQISDNGGTDPVWRRYGGELYYRNGDLMMAVSITGGQNPAVSKPSLLWQGHYMAGVGSSCGIAGPTSSNYDVTAGGERFLMIQDKSQDVVSKLLHVVPNWSEEVKRRAGN